MYPVDQDFEAVAASCGQTCLRRERDRKWKRCLLAWSDQRRIGNADLGVHLRNVFSVLTLELNPQVVGSIQFGGMDQYAQGKHHADGRGKLRTVGAGDATPKDVEQPFAHRHGVTQQGAVDPHVLVASHN
jgi:hypothetical protein